MALLMGIVLFQANGVLAEDDAEMKGLKELCNGKKNDSACFKLGEKYRIVELDKKTAEHYYLKACETGHLDGCTFGAILMTERGRSEWKKAGKLFQKACDEKQVFACFNLGSLKYKEGRQKTAIKYFNISCDMGHKQSCINANKLKR